MITIKMLRDEPIQTETVGLRILKKGEEYEIDDKNAQSLLGRGYAVLVVKNGKNKLERSELERMTVIDLRKLAEEHGIQDTKVLRKTDLLDALCPPAEDVEKEPEDEENEAA